MEYNDCGTPKVIDFVPACMFELVDDSDPGHEERASPTTMTQRSLLPMNQQRRRPTGILHACENRAMRREMTSHLPLLPNASSQSLHPSGAMTERKSVAKSRDDCPMLNRGMKGKNIAARRSSEATQLRQVRGIDQTLAQSRHKRPFALAGVAILAASDSVQEPNSPRKEIGHRSHFPYLT
jgi:hypothetical protein